MVLAFHMILQDHLTQSQAVLLVGATQVSHQSAKFGGHRHCRNGDIMVLVCQVISQDHVNKGHFIL